ncbi:type IV secretion system protein VirB4, partial [Priestia megaterium]
MTLPFGKKEKTPQEIKQKKGYNPYFVAQIQPQGGVSFKENLVRNGDGYSTC